MIDTIINQTNSYFNKNIVLVGLGENLVLILYNTGNRYLFSGDYLYNMEEIMHLASIYLIAKDFNKSVDFYEKILEMKVSKQNMDRFAMFEFEGQCIAIMNGYFDSQNPEKVIHKGQYNAYFDDYNSIVQMQNSRKVVLNFWDEDLEKEYNRVKQLNITDTLTHIKYVCNVCPYYYFQLADPDGNVIEVTGEYTPKEGEFNE